MVRYLYLSIVATLIISSPHLMAGSALDFSLKFYYCNMSPAKPHTVLPRLVLHILPPDTHAGFPLSPTPYRESRVPGRICQPDTILYVS
ncbi:hypothetical protein HOY80DRAFT_957164 [Tuber brumale]|nr:hypothetical protein HOY80DRAFT_957164 [Tuber brumale]